MRTGTVLFFVFLLKKFAGSGLAVCLERIVLMLRDF